MKPCPNCGQRSLPWFYYAFSALLKPVKCRICKTSLRLPAWALFFLAILSALLAPALVLVGLHFMSLWPVVALIVGWVATIVLVALLTTPVAVSEEGVAKGKRVVAILLLVLAVAVVISEFQESWPSLVD